MLAQERLGKIREMVKRDGKVYVSSLCEIFNISEDSIRKDLKKLENQGLIERIYGGALLKEQPDLINGKVRIIRFDSRLSKDVPLKDIIAEKALNIIENGEVIYIDSSTTNVLLAEKLAKSNKRITVVSNCLNVLSYLTENPNIKVICPGGNYDAEVAGFSGVSALRVLENFYFDKAFIGIVAVDYSTGDLLLDNFEDSEVKSKLIEISKSSILVCLSQKLGKRTNYKFGELSQIDTIITELNPREVEDRLKDFDINII
jgi:DeoR/GlpR family transcriptional regulator of sugar metabolism